MAGALFEAVINNPYLNNKNLWVFLFTESRIMRPVQKSAGVGDANQYNPGISINRPAIKLPVELGRSPAYFGAAPYGYPVLLVSEKESINA